jgi:integrase-like protein
MRQALRYRRAKRPAGTGCLPVQADDTARLAARGTGSRLPGNPGMAGHRHASDRSRRHQKNRQPLIGLNRIIPLASRRASWGQHRTKPRRSRISADRPSRMVRVTTRELFRRFMVLLYRHTPAQDQRQGLAFRVHRQIYDLNWNLLRKLETLHGITSLAARQAGRSLSAARPRVVRIGHQAARAPDRYLRVRARHAQAWRPQLWLGVNNRGPMTANGIYQMIARRGRQCGVDAWPHRFRHHFSHTWLDRGGAEGDLMELNGWSSPQMLRRYGASARSARARRTYDRIMAGSP